MMTQEASWLCHGGNHRFYLDAATGKYTCSICDELFDKRLHKKQADPVVLRRKPARTKKKQPSTLFDQTDRPDPRDH